MYSLQLLTTPVMDTIPETRPGTILASTPIDTTSTAAHAAARASKGLASGSRFRHAWIYRRVLTSGLVEPFRKVLRPLIRWLFQPHFKCWDGPRHESRIDIPMRRPSMGTLGLSIVLGPLVFLMLLPLVLVLVPVAALIGVAAVMAASMQTGLDGGGKVRWTTT